MRLLLLEHDLSFGKRLRDYLRSGDQVVDWYQRLSDVYALRNEPYDVLLVNWELPDGPGLEWVRSLRRAGNATSALILAAQSFARERTRGLNSGADDVILKPIEAEELSAKIRAVRRRAAGFGSSRISLGMVQVDLNERAAAVDGVRVELTPREWSVLEALVLRTGSVVSKRDLEALVLGLDDEVASNAMEVHVWSLRRKLGRSLIQTVRGFGYRIAA